MNINNLFPTPVAFFNIGRSITKKELEFIKQVEKRSNVGNITSATSNLLEQEELKDIANFINEKIKDYFDEVYKPQRKVELYITQSWSNYTTKGQYHHKHRHPNSFVSGVFYINADRSKDKIKFFNDKIPYMEVTQREYNLYNSDSWWFNVGSSDLVIFPSTLWHMVDQVESDEERISISFNTFLKGEIGEDDAMTGLRL